MKVFVYGSLKQGYWNNPVLGGSQFLGKARTLNEFVLTNCGFPYMIFPHKSEAIPAPVEGEVYEVSEESIKEDLDCLEGVPHHYERRKIMIVDESNNMIEASTYIAAGDNGLDHPPCGIFNDHYVWKG